MQIELTSATFLPFSLRIEVRRHVLFRPVVSLTANLSTRQLLHRVLGEEVLGKVTISCSPSYRLTVSPFQPFNLTRLTISYEQNASGRQSNRDSLPAVWVFRHIKRQQGDRSFPRSWGLCYLYAILPNPCYSFCHAPRESNRSSLFLFLFLFFPHLIMYACG